MKKEKVERWKKGHWSPLPTTMKNKERSNKAQREEKVKRDEKRGTNAITSKCENVKKERGVT